MDLKPILFREAPVSADTARVREIIESSGFFSPQEIEVAQELVEERLTKGISSGYLFLFAEAEGRVIGYTCYGPIPCTMESYDLYWIAVEQTLRGTGFGRELLQRTERAIGRAG
ncbi:MAG: GNAT family N-acetyltransferase, partial [Desulfobulbaceae bacterium]|nr:GNAT family N-acetyltransferase [Desulfobulbaceae bacterium]